MKNDSFLDRTLKPLCKIPDNQKLHKPMIEKKRRARINKSLTELRMLINDLLKKELIRTRSKRKSGKFEKADVLELTVRYIKEMKHEISIQNKFAFEQGYDQCKEQVEKYFNKIFNMKEHSFKFLDQNNLKNVSYSGSSSSSNEHHLMDKLSQNLIKKLNSYLIQYINANKIDLNSNLTKKVSQNGQNLNETSTLDELNCNSPNDCQQLDRNDGCCLKNKLQNLDTTNQLANNNKTNLEQIIKIKKTISNSDELNLLKNYNQYSIENSINQKPMYTLPKSFSSTCCLIENTNNLNENSSLKSLNKLNFLLSSSSSSCSSSLSSSSSIFFSSSLPISSTCSSSNSITKLPALNLYNSVSNLNYSNSPIKKRKIFLTKSNENLTNYKSIWRPW